jgi:hypothetical protein
MDFNENYLESLLTGALKVFNDFSYYNQDNYFIEYDLKHKNYKLLLEKYNLQDIAGNGNDFEKSINVMRWVNDNVMHNWNNNDIITVQCDALSILNYSYGKGKDFGLVCRHQAIVFTECCLALGLISKTIYCYPYNPYDYENHVVSMVYLKELKKWGMFDPSNNAYFMNNEGLILSPTEARYYLSINEIQTNADIRKDTNYYKRYMAKNLFYIKYCAKNTFGSDLVKDQKTYYLIPYGFNVKEREICYCEGAIKNSNEVRKSWWEKELEKIKKSEINSVSENQFLRIE